MDKKDEEILNVLKEHARLQTKSIAKKTKLPITTVHNRIKKLEKEGIITGYSAKLDYKKIGFPISAFILITVDYRLLKEKNTTQYEVVKTLRRQSQVVEAAMLTGTSDIIIKIRAKSIESLNDFVTIYLRNIDGIEKTSTAVILNEA